ncbi:MAG TPA: hypothetical protein V6D47_05090 [Oscillatoriaceae cyanobacterium]
MLTLQHRIVVEDELGEKHALNLLEIVADRYFVMLPPEQAEKLQTLQSRFTRIIDPAVTILMDALVVVSVREHRFLQPDELPEVLSQSRHHILRICAARLIDALPVFPDISETAMATAFREECRLRKGW